MDQEILENVGKTIAEDSVSFTIDVFPKNKIHHWLQKKGWAKTQKAYSIRPITFGNLHRISSLLLTINLKKEITQQELGYLLMRDHSETLAKIIAIAIQNTKAAPPAYLSDELLYGLTSKESLQLLFIVLRQMDIAGFLNTMVLIRGLNVVEKKKPNDDENQDFR